MNKVNKNLFITGGSNGIGAAIARLYGRRGTAVFFTGRDAGACRVLADEINDAGVGSAGFALGDVGDEADVARCCAEAAAFFEGKNSGTVDVLVANAGCGGGRMPLEATEASLFDRQFSTNVKGVYLFLRALLPQMKARGAGQIVVTSSVAGIRPIPNGAIYASTKWAVEGLVRSVREELKAAPGVKIATINPGPVDTLWWKFEERGGRRPDGAIPERMLTPEDCAEAARTIIDQAETSDIGSIVLDA
eukprot:g2075.t1